VVRVAAMHHGLSFEPAKRQPASSVDEGGVG